MKLKTKRDYRRRRHTRLRKRVFGTAERPRLCVCFSNKHIYAQVIDDTAGRTLASASTCGAQAGDLGGVSVEAAGRVGQVAAQKAVEQGIQSVVFDRGGFRFGARMKALA